jgi:glutamate-ammonia-ligase adenylyltransferase
VLTAEFSAPLPDRAGLAADLQGALAGARDFEDTLDLMRRWAGERRFQVGVQLLRRGIEGDRSGGALADIAETALATLLPAVAEDFARVHGTVPGGAFSVVAMGRLGSREMSLASDLDLILIYDAPPDSAGSLGARPLALSTYYARLSQRLISAITAPTAEGRLYEVDMRLRPSGESGPIASSLAAFAQYQREAAWTWEHMALTRARPLVGDSGLCERVALAITTALSAPRDKERLVVDVAEMRRRIALSIPRPSRWDLRNRRGGLVDLEFTVQYLMLREAARAPAVLRRETGAALQALGAAGALPPQGVRELADALALLRHLRALLALLFDGVPDPAALAGPAGATLARCAGAIDFARLDADMSAACARVRVWYDRLIARPARLAARSAAARRVAQSREDAIGETAR